MTHQKHTEQEIAAAWNAQADELNQWDELDLQEKIEWAAKFGKDQAARRAQVVKYEAGEMTSERAAYFMRRFLHEEKLLGPNEQAALHYVIGILTAAPQPPEAGLMSEKRTTKPEAAPVQMPNVDTIGVMLELESRIQFVESQTTRRAMEAAVQLLRILADHGVK